jgi:hypothetical protein
VTIGPESRGGDLDSFTQSSLSVAPNSVTARLPPTVAAYLDAIVRDHGAPDGPLVSLILFGSAATGGYAVAGSDIDLLVVLRDDIDAGARVRVRNHLANLEARHGLEKPRARLSSFLAKALVALADRLTANVRSFFVCTRTDLLSGEPKRILSIPAFQAYFVDRAAIPSIVRSGVTVWGEELLALVPLPPIRRRDVAMAFFGLWNQLLFTIVAYPLLPGATRYAMDALKRSVHNCYFCYHGSPASLAVEVAFFEKRYGSMRTLRDLLALRQIYRSSFTFTLRCAPTVARLHMRAARDVPFPVYLQKPREQSGPVSMRLNGP